MWKASAPQSFSRLALSRLPLKLDIDRSNISKTMRTVSHLKWCFISLTSLYF